MEAKKIKHIKEIVSGTLLPDDDDIVAYFQYIGEDNEPVKHNAIPGDTIGIWQTELHDYWDERKGIEYYFTETWGYINNYLFEIGEPYEDEHGSYVYVGVIVDVL